MSVRIAICDDTIEDIELLKEALYIYDGAFEISIYTNGESLIRELMDSGDSIDILFLDIFMPGMDGVKTARRIQDIKKDIKIIFISYSREHYPQVYELFAFNYIVKPFDKERVFAVLDRALEVLGREKACKISFSYKSAAYSIDVSRIMYIESRDKLLLFHLIDFVGVMKRLADEGRYEELRRFLIEYTDTSETAPLPVFCDNVVVNSIIGYYSLKAAGHNILFCCVCSVPERLPISDENLCVVLGNTLENALEACQKVSPPRERFIRVEAETAGSRLLIRIENSYDGRLEKRNGEYISTKPGQNHGIGLRNIKKIAESGGGYLKTEHTDTTFTLMAALSLTEAPKP